MNAMLSPYRHEVFWFQNLFMKFLNLTDVLWISTAYAIGVPFYMLSMWKAILASWLSG
jgi:hypothetical protein